MKIATRVSIIAMLQFALSSTISVFSYSGKFQFTQQYLSTLRAEIIVILRQDGFSRLQRKEIAEIVRESNAAALAHMAHRRRIR